MGLFHGETVSRRLPGVRLVAVADPVGEADAFATEKLIRFAPTAWCTGGTICIRAKEVPASASGPPSG